MASFNTNSNPSPFGTSSATPQPNIGAQFFLGCSVIDFTVNADWSSQGGNLTVNLLEDTLSTSNLDYNNAYARWSLGSTYVQKLRDPNIYDYATGTLANGSLPVIGSPQHFRLVDTSNAIVFQYDGILSSISRNASPNAGKIYTVELTSPLKLLENCSILLKSTPGFGYAIEGNPSGISMNGYYENNSVADPVYYNSNTNRYTSIQLDTNLSKGFVATSGLKTNEIYDTTTVGTAGNFALEKNFLTQNIGPTFGTNNRAINWGNVYNLQNVFGIFENESYGLTNYARFGGSRSAGNATKDEGLRLDMIAFALDELINRNADSSPLPAKRYFGGNIISGTTTYNFYDVSQGNVASNPYFFGFDVYSFTTYMINKLGADYVYTGNLSSNLLEFISTLCSDAGVDFIVELNRIQTSDAGAPNYWDGTDTVSNYDSPGSLYNGGTFHLEKSFTNSVPGGIISIKILDRRSLSISDPANIRTPFSKIAYQILGYEVPDYGDKGLGYINPGDPNPFSSAFEWGAFGNTYLDPLDDDYVLKGTDGSSPYGGKFPVVTKADQNVLANTAGLDINDVRQNASQTTVKIQDNQQTTAKFVVGGKQSRVVHVPQEYIYQYWGEISVEPTGNECLNDGTENRLRPIPVITPFLEPDDVVDFIMIDTKSIFGNINDSILNNVNTSGVYCASVVEIRAAMKGFSNWLDFIHVFKPCVSAALQAYAGLDINNALDQLVGTQFKLNQTANSISVDTNEPTHQASETATNGGESHLTPSKKLSEKDESNRSLNGAIVEDIEKKLHEKIKFIGDTHYGKSWVVWTPQSTPKVTAEDPTNLTNYGKYDNSWSPVADAYLEPSAFNEFRAPKHTKFMNGARVCNYANYYSVINSGDILIDRQKNYQNLSSSPYPVNDAYIDLYDNKPYSFDFSEISETDKAQFNTDIYNTSTCSETRTSLKIQSESEFTFVPYDYFYYYDRGRKPYFSPVTTGIYGISYSGNYCRVQYPGMIIESGYDIYRGTSKAGSSPTNIAMLPSSLDYEKEEVTNSILKQTILERIMCGGNTSSVWTNGSPVFQYVNNISLTEDFLDLMVPDNGINCITFTRITTPFVKYPITDGDTRKYTNFGLNILAPAMFNIANGGENINIDGENTPDSHKNSTYHSDEFYPPCIQPTEVGLAQQSTRHHYGPWFTQHNFIYGGKVEYIEDESLVPENFIFPVYGTLSSLDSNAPAFSSILSGFYGMNLAGQAIANSIDGYGQFAAEDGSLTIPGAPLVKRIGDALLGGPYITSINVSVGVQGITTQYTFNSVTSRSGKTNTDIVNKIRRVSNAVLKR